MNNNNSKSLIKMTCSRNYYRMNCGNQHTVRRYHGLMQPQQQQQQQQQQDERRYQQRYFFVIRDGTYNSAPFAIMVLLILLLNTPSSDAFVVSTSGRNFPTTNQPTSSITTTTRRILLIHKQQQQQQTPNHFRILYRNYYRTTIRPFDVVRLFAKKGTSSSSKNVPKDDNNEDDKYDEGYDEDYDEDYDDDDDDDDDDDSVKGSSSTNNDVLKEYGTETIIRAVMSCGIQNVNDINIKWKTDRIIVCITNENLYSGGESTDEADVDLEQDDYDDADDDEDIDIDAENGTDEEIDDDFNNKPIDGFVDITKIARTINKELEVDERGIQLAERYEIEVTTPGSDDVLRGPIMFTAYRGFDVIVTTVVDPSKNKKNKKNTNKKLPNDSETENDNASETVDELQPVPKFEEVDIEGKLVERTDEYTVINIKGRMKRIPNDTIVTVRLPKAKKEKGVR